ncbi:MAG: cytochrome-c peroxidase [Pseudomonadales bacterium]
MSWAMVMAASASAAAQQCLTEPPPGFPEVDLTYQSGLGPPPSDKADQARIALGQRLFSDARLSINSSISCASCHNPAAGFADPRPQSVGALGETLTFNAPTLFNAALKHRLHWQIAGPTRLVEQHASVLTSTDPVEMGFSPARLTPLNRDNELLALLDTAQLASTDSAATTHKQAFDADAVASLLARYVSTLVCATNFDAFLLTDRSSALTAQQRQGLTLFTSAPRNCHHCHQGPLLGGGLRSTSATFPALQSQRHRNGQPVTLNVPALRQIKHTAPYFADGSAQSLEAVLQRYADGDFADQPGFTMSPEEQQALLAFLGIL